MKPCKNCIHHTACVTANPDMVKKTFECEHFEDKEKIKFAFEKQIPKKVMPYNKFERHCECGAIVKSYCKFCYECGQALDWSEEDG